MKKIINHKLYDTETAQYYCEFLNKKLFRKKTGEFFLFNEKSQSITAVSIRAAMEWVYKYLGVDEYWKIFGEKDTDKKINFTFRIDESLVNTFKRLSDMEEISLNTYLERLIKEAKNKAEEPRKAPKYTVNFICNSDGLCSMNTEITDILGKPQKLESSVHLNQLPRIDEFISEKSDRAEKMDIFENYFKYWAFHHLQSELCSTARKYEVLAEELIFPEIKITAELLYKCSGKPYYPELNKLFVSEFYNE